MNLPITLRETTINNLLPQPVNISPGPTDFFFSDSSTIDVRDSDDSRGLWIGTRLAEMIEEEFGVRPAVRGLDPTNRTDPSDRFELRIGKAVSARNKETRTFGDEGYSLTVDGHGVRIVSSGDNGLLWGAMTLRQLLVRHAGQLAAVGVAIQDRPRYRWRGFMIDAGRAPNSMGQIQRIIRIGSAFKLNLLVFREGDDELCAVRYRTNRLGSDHPHALSMEQMGTLTAYAEQYGVTLIPEIESLGHSAAKGAYYPDLVMGGTEHVYTDRIRHLRKVHLRPGGPRVYSLLESMYREWLEILRRPMLHIGLDEVHLEASEQARHLDGLLAMIDRLGEETGQRIRPIVWGDAPSTPGSHADRVVRCLWEYPSQGPVGLGNEYLIKQGLAELSRVDCTQEVFMAGGSDSFHTPYAKSDYRDAFSNLASWARWGTSRANFTGLLAVQWGGNMVDRWLPDFLAAGDWGWNPPVSEPAFEEEMRRVRWNLDRLSDAARPKAEAVDRPAWDGIWLAGDGWGEEVGKGEC